MNNEPAILYFRNRGVIYCVKVSHSTLRIKIHPSGGDMIFVHTFHPVFDGQTWDFVALARLIDQYSVKLEQTTVEMARFNESRIDAAVGILIKWMIETHMPENDIDQTDDPPK